MSLNTNDWTTATASTSYCRSCKNTNWLIHVVTDQQTNRLAFRHVTCSRTSVSLVLDFNELMHSISGACVYWSCMWNIPFSAVQYVSLRNRKNLEDNLVRARVPKVSESACSKLSCEICRFPLGVRSLQDSFKHTFFINCYFNCLSLPLLVNVADGGTLVSTHAFHLWDPGFIPARCSYRAQHLEFATPPRGTRVNATTMISATCVNCEALASQGIESQN